MANVSSWLLGLSCIIWSPSTILVNFAVALTMFAKMWEEIQQMMWLKPKTWFDTLDTHCGNSRIRMMNLYLVFYICNRNFTHISGVWISTWHAARWESGTYCGNCVPHTWRILWPNISSHHYTNCADYNHCFCWNMLPVKFTHTCYFILRRNIPH